jgi:hypothetical protein
MDERLRFVAKLFDGESIMNHDLTELLVARQQLIEWFELAQCTALERPTHVFVDKRFEPIPQGARLRRNCIQLTGNRVLPQSVQHVARYQSSLPEPSTAV